jgi:hypothetical protein
MGSIEDLDAFRGGSTLKSTIFGLKSINFGRWLALWERESRPEENRERKRGSFFGI